MIKVSARNDVLHPQQQPDGVCVSPNPLLRFVGPATDEDVVQQALEALVSKQLYTVCLKSGSDEVQCTALQCCTRTCVLHCSLGTAIGTTAFAMTMLCIKGPFYVAVNKLLFGEQRRVRRRLFSARSCQTDTAAQHLHVQRQRPMQHKQQQWDAVGLQPLPLSITRCLLPTALSSWRQSCKMGACVMMKK
jgi:hypothetical protein